MLKKYPVLESLSPEQVIAITTLSESEFGKKLGEKIGEQAERIENDIKEVFGVDRQPSERHFEYLKRVGGDVMTQLKTLKEKGGGSDEWKKKYDELVKSGKGSDQLKKDFEDLQSKFQAEQTRATDLQKKLDGVNADYQKQLDQKDSEMQQYLLRSMFMEGLQGIKPKPGVDDKLFEEIKNNRLNALLSGVKMERNTGSDGKEIVQFRDSEGNLLTDADNGHNPHTAKTLVKARFKDVIDSGRQQSGGGTKPMAAAGGAKGSIVISGARSKTEADELIRTELAARGIATSSPEYQQLWKQAREDNKVNELPLNAKP